MKKYKYNVSYIENGIVKPLKFNGKNLFDSDLKTIDRSTVKLKDEEMLLLYLKEVKMIPKYIDKLYISYKVENEDKQHIIYDGDILLFSEDKDKFNYEYILKMFDNLKRNRNELLKLCQLYTKKYSLPKEKLEIKKYKHFKNMLKRIKSIAEYVRRNENIFLDSGNFLEEIKLDKYIDEFILKEFFSETKNGNVLKYSNLRDFIIKLKYVSGEYNIDRSHDYLEYNETEKE